METKHTPGPWKANDFRQDNIDHPATAVWSADGMNFICIVRADGKTGAPSVRQAHFNARFIAEAPATAAERDRLRAVNAELVAALERLTNAAMTRDRTNVEDALVTARAALARAKGV